MRNEADQVVVLEKALKTKRSKERKCQSLLIKCVIAKHRILALITIGSNIQQKIATESSHIGFSNSEFIYLYFQIKKKSNKTKQTFSANLSTRKVL